MILRWILIVVLILLTLFVFFWFLLPREPVEVKTPFDPSDIGDDLDSYLADFEAAFDSITPGVEKRIVWAGDKGDRTEDVILYLHGFSATSEEIRPLPDKLAESLGANLLFWRLPGHGRDGAAMAEPRAGDWIASTDQALEVAKRLGDRITVLSTSTGGTLAALATLDPKHADAIERQIFVSPNFEISAPTAKFLNLPGARLWVPLVAGKERSFEASTPEHERYWTTQYPTVSLIPLAALVEVARSADYAQTDIPALFIFSDRDDVVSPAATREIAQKWGGPVTLLPQDLPEDTPSTHVIAGDILNPDRTDLVLEEILNWINSQ